ncbi:MAG TPA: acyl-CoA dehydrogenase family protein, partial [Steroidobacteraceae bacterium]|nr:acyl-CoA dehydrogenase family protein [Steroidobacteraceae bacterium]
MASYKAPLREIQFLLHDVLNVEQLAKLPGYADATRDTLDGLLDEAAKLVEERLAPLNAGADAGCNLDDGKVTTPPGFREFYQLYAQAGWMGLSHPVEHGGQGLPYIASKVVEEMVCSASVAFALYPGLTAGCFEALHASATDEIKHAYLPKLASGEWAGTMCMTEPQAGSDVGAVKTKATLQGDGSYSIEGSKIFISSGEHDLAGNIIHFVLARLPDSPAGVKGLSTFVVPKLLLKADGTPGERNKVRCVSIEHKMGLHGSCTCSLTFEGAKGWIVGAPNQGIQNMFVMMNLARIMVGFQGLGVCELATQNAIRYALDRKQGKATNGSATIVEHADVRRMLLTMKAVTEGARMLGYETALHVDIAKQHPDAAVREAAQDWVDLTTPLVKAYLTDSAVDLGSLAVQVYGGHGYIREHGVEQAMRDAKILCLYEGTNGIQAMDLVRRKLMLHNGRLAQRFFDRARAELKKSHTDGLDLAFIEKPLAQTLDQLEVTTKWLQQAYKSNPDDGGMGAVDFQRAFALTALGCNWLRMARAAAKLTDKDYAQAKRVT